jgi:hypothetical protein
VSEPQTPTGKRLLAEDDGDPYFAMELATVEAEAARSERERLYTGFERICATEATEDGMLWPQDIDDLLTEPEAGS